MTGRHQEATHTHTPKHRGQELLGTYYRNAMDCIIPMLKDVGNTILEYAAAKEKEIEMAQKPRKSKMTEDGSPRTTAHVPFRGAVY